MHTHHNQETRRGPSCLLPINIESFGPSYRYAENFLMIEAKICSICVCPVWVCHLQATQEANPIFGRELLYTCNGIHRFAVKDGRGGFSENVRWYEETMTFPADTTGDLRRKPARAVLSHSLLGPLASENSASECEMSRGGLQRQKSLFGRSSKGAVVGT